MHPRYIPCLTKRLDSPLDRSTKTEVIYERLMLICDINNVDMEHIIMVENKILNFINVFSKFSIICLHGKMAWPFI